MTTRRSLVYSFLDRYASLVISIVSSMFIARLLSPSEIGVFSIAMVVVGIVSTVRDMGAGQYLVQAKELTADRIRAVWTVQLAFGAGLALLLVLLSHPLAAFYNHSVIGQMLLILAVNFLLNPLGSVTYAWLMRELKFDSIALIRFGSTVGGAVASVYLAWMGVGAISLAWGALCSTVMTALLSVFFRPAGYPWLPGTREVRSVLAFGSKVTLTSIVNTVAKGSPEFLLGRLHDFAAAGFYSRANGVVQMFYRLVQEGAYNVAYALFAKEARQGQSSQGSFERATLYVCVLAWSFAGFLFCLAFPLVRLLYGDQWDQAVEPVRILCVGLVVAAPASFGYALMLSRGKAGETARLSIRTAAVMLACVGAGVSFGVVGVCWGLVASSLVSTVLWARHLATHLGVRFRPLAAGLVRTGVVAASSWVGPALAVALWGWRPTQTAWPLLASSVLAAAGFAVAITLARHPILEEVIRVGRAIRQKLPGRG